MLVSGRINCAVQFCTALPCQAVPIWPVRYANFRMQLPHGSARTDLLEFAELGVRSIYPAFTSLQKLSFCKVADPSEDDGRALSVLQICTAPTSRRAGDLPLAQLCKFIAISVWSRQKCIFTYREPPFCYNDKKKFDADFFFRQFQTFLIAKFFMLFLILVVFGYFSSPNLPLSSNKSTNSKLRYFRNFRISAKGLGFRLLFSPFWRHLNTTIFNQAKLIRK